MQTPLICRRLVECFLSVMCGTTVGGVVARYGAVNPNMYVGRRIGRWTEWMSSRELIE